MKYSNFGDSDMRYLVISLSLLLFVGCGESQYERCLKVEKAKVVENWEDIYRIAKRLVLNFSFPLDFRGVLDNDITALQDIQKLRDGLQVLADLPLVEIQKKLTEIAEMIEQGIEEPALGEAMEASEAEYLKVIQAWDQYNEIADESLAAENSEFLRERIDEVILSYQATVTSDNQYYLYFGVPDEMMLAAQYKIINEIEKSIKEDMKKLDMVQNEIASNICNSRGLY